MKKPNRLLEEKSPYLLQHAYNPVDWYPWGEEAFVKARKEDKPIFLSIGYSTCYWCHVMEREVFENESIAELMNENVVCVKVDREERPDVDRIYMRALQGMTGSGGWPLSMFLTPDLVPFFSATYIPPVAQYGRAGFPEVMNKIMEVWKSDRGQINQVSTKIKDFLKESSSPGIKPIDPDNTPLERGFESFSESYDEKYGGFGGAPKFPRPVTFNFLLRYYKSSSDSSRNPDDRGDRALQISIETLKQMAKGGIYDHIGGGYHRYATDEKWHVPHFEKMLYDQAQLVVAYLEVYQITRDSFYSSVADGILAYVLKDLTGPEGGFYSAEDAESAPDSAKPEIKKEGAYYVWTKGEIDSMLDPSNAAIFCFYYGVEEGGNVIADPMGEFGGKNILYIARTVGETAEKFGIDEKKVQKSLKNSKEIILRERGKRVRPHLDDKILVSWNGLMISAFARAFRILRNDRYLSAAERSARFILNNMYDGEKKELLRRYREGEARFEAHLEDYAFFLQGLLDLYETSPDPVWLETALKLADRMIALFYDQQQEGFFDVSGRDSSIIVRTKEWYDSAEPSGNSIAILNLLRLSQMTDNGEYNEKAIKSLAYFGEYLLKAPEGGPQLLTALRFSLSKPRQIIIAGEGGTEGTEKILNEIHTRFLPDKIVLLIDDGEFKQFFKNHLPFIESFKMIDGKPTVYICENYTCRLPENDPAKLQKLLV